MSKTKKVLATLLVVGLTGGLAALGTFSAFSSTTTNPSNNFSSGSVSITDNDSGGFMYQVTNAKPGTTVTKCIQLTYGGSLASTVKLYTPDTIGSLGSYIDLTITQGTQGSPSFPSCTGFSADSVGQIYSGTLANFASTYNAWSNGLTVNLPSQTSWGNGDIRVYQVTATLQSGAPNSAQSSTANSHSFTWEAQNQ
jgi:predicted ribosomally synthesized peptide with SipW-like signal peptide